MAGLSPGFIFHDLHMKNLEVKHGVLEIRTATTVVLPETRIKLYVEWPHRHFFWCNIYRTNKEMIEGINQIRKPAIRPPMLACCLTYHIDDMSMRFRELGTVFFSKNELPPWIIAHEMTHAATSWARRKNLDPVHAVKYPEKTTPKNHPEEEFCCVVEYMIHQFYARQANKVFYTCGRGPAPLYMNIKIPRAA